MKKLKYLFRVLVLLMVGVVVLVSCKDDESNNQLQTLIVTPPIGTPYFEGVDMYFVGDITDWKIIDEFKMSSFPHNYALKDSLEARTYAGRRYSITLTNLTPGTEYKYVMKLHEADAVALDGAEHMEVDANGSEVANHVLKSSRAINDTLANWKGITVDGQLAHKFAVTVPVDSLIKPPVDSLNPLVGGDIYLVDSTMMANGEINEAYKLNRVSDGKYSFIMDNMVDSVKYNYVLVVNGEKYIEVGAYSASTKEYAKAAVRKIGLFDVRQNHEVINWNIPVPEESEEPEPETEPVPVPEE